MKNNDFDEGGRARANTETGLMRTEGDEKIEIEDKNRTYLFKKSKFHIKPGDTSRQLTSSVNTSNDEVSDLNLSPIKALAKTDSSSPHFG